MTPGSMPRLPDAVEKASEEHRLVVFIGAGVSCTVGLPSWDKVKDDLILQMRLSAGEDERIRDEFRSMEHYDCFEAIYRRDRTTYDCILGRALDCSRANYPLFQRLLRSLMSLKPASLVTTNIDDLLFESKEFRTDQFRYMDTCAPQELRTDKVFCLHGDRKKNVFNNYDATKLYDSQHFKAFLTNLFGSYCVLFVGFSFRDRRLLQYAEVNPDFGRQTQSFVGHFALMASNQAKPSTLELQMKYGIDVLRYDNTDGSHSNFRNTILSWEGLPLR